MVQAEFFGQEAGAKELEKVGGVPLLREVVVAPSPALMVNPVPLGRGNARNQILGL